MYYKLHKPGIYKSKTLGEISPRILLTWDSKRKFEKFVPLFDSVVVGGTLRSQFREADPCRLLYRFLK